MHRFTCGERKIWWNIKKSQNIRKIIVSSVILDLSKTQIYEFWYEYIKEKFADQAKLCYIGTDSSSYILKLKIFMKILKVRLKQQDLIHQIWRALPIGQNSKKVIDMIKMSWVENNESLLV